MQSNFTQGPAFTTPKFRVSFPNVFQPSAYNDGKPSFNLTMLFPKETDLTVFKNALRAVMVQRWGDKLPKVASPFKSGDSKEYDGYANMIYIKVANYVYDAKNEHKARPGIVDINRQAILTPAEFYAGCYARATVFAKATGGPGTRYEAKVAFGLRNLQKLEDGEPFGTTPVAAENDFDPIEGTMVPSSAVVQGDAFDFLATGAESSDDIPF